MKDRLRKTLLQRRSRYTETEIGMISRRITHKVVELQACRQARTVHCYFSFRKEVSTRLLMDLLQQAGKLLVVPRMIAGTNLLEHVLFSSDSRIIPNVLGIPEPAGSTVVQTGSIDLVIVPMVGGDPACNRLGYGKGYYDQFLSGLSCPKIGLLPDDCLVDSLPVEPHDVKLDMIITESSVYQKA
ncbi:MAG: 5-formyltetrahydrofolate cyclo-ligase [Balneolales bacterium]